MTNQGQRPVPDLAREAAASQVSRWDCGAANRWVLGAHVRLLSRLRHRRQHQSSSSSPRPQNQTWWGTDERNGSTAQTLAIGGQAAQRLNLATMTRLLIAAKQRSGHCSESTGSSARPPVTTTRESGHPRKHRLLVATRKGRKRGADCTQSLRRGEPNATVDAAWSALFAQSHAEDCRHGANCNKYFELGKISDQKQRTIVTFPVHPKLILLASCPPRRHCRGERVAIAAQ